MRYEVKQLSGGWKGTEETVEAIRALIRDSLADPKVVLTARSIVRDLPERDKKAEREAVSNFVRSKMRYTNEGIETLSTPRTMLDEIERYGKAVGDCDDHVILWGALLKALGHAVRFRVVSQRKNRVASHIWGEVYDPKTETWIADDTIAKRHPIGWRLSRRITMEQVYGFEDVAGVAGLEEAG